MNTNPGRPGNRRGGRARFLTPAEEQTIRAALAAGFTRDEAAAEVGITRSTLDARLRDQLADLRVGRGRRERRRAPQPELTPDEIAYRTHLVRSRWPAERWLRPELPDAPAHRPGAADTTQ
jgi:hypothetical protein